MEILNLILAIITATLGLPIGFIIAKIAKEELNAGKYYFTLLQNLILIVIINIFFYSFNLKTSTFILVVLITSFMIMKFKPRAIMGYILFGLLSYLRLDNLQFIIIASSLTFLYGLPTAALIKIEGLIEIKNPLRYIKKTTQIIGHRGAPKHITENTISSFKKAIELGVDMVETDARITKDKKIVLMHDAKIDRTTNGTGIVNNLTLKKIKKFKTKNQETVPTLQELLILLKKEKIGVNIHVKEDKAMSKVIEIIKKSNFQKHTLISSFSEHALKKAKEILPSIRTAYLFSKPKLKYISIGKRLGVEALHPVYPILTNRMVMRAHQNGFRVNVWTIRKKRSAFKSKLYGVDGIIADDPLLYTIELKVN